MRARVTLGDLKECVVLTLYAYFLYNYKPRYDFHCIHTVKFDRSNLLHWQMQDANANRKYSKSENRKQQVISFHICCDTNFCWYDSVIRSWTP